jgi:hypothetical protein
VHGVDAESWRRPCTLRKTTMTHSHSHDGERRIRERALDETLSGTFPASDARSSLPNPDDDSVDAVSSTNEPDASSRSIRPPAEASLLSMK